MGWVKWQQWDRLGCIGMGEMPPSNVRKSLAALSKEAANILKQKNADHVLYAVKYYNEDSGALEEVRFYMEPMTDEAFEKAVAGLSNNTLVYAVHALK